jgi:hypothetical protein
MPITPNYGWTTPVVNGDFGAWGGILNAAFVEIDADVKALADTVAANAANAARTNVNNSFSGTQTFNTVVASGNVVASGSVTALGELIVQGAGRGIRMNVGAVDATYIEMFARSASPSTSSGLIGFRDVGGPVMSVVNSLGGIDINSTSGTLFVGGGGTTSSGPVNAPQFNGSGANLTGITQSQITNLVSDLAAKAPAVHTHPQSQIDNLVSDLAAKAPAVHTHPQSQIDNLVSDLASKANVTHTHDAAAIVSGLLPWTRIAPPPRIDFAADTTQAFQFPTAMQLAPDGIAAPTLNRPGGFTSYSWTWINVAPVGGNIATWIPVLSGVNI